jgi:hypothetical protein
VPSRAGLDWILGQIGRVDLSAVTRAGEVTIELATATPEQVTTIVQALARSSP